MKILSIESESTVWSDAFQISFYVGINMENILYGVELFLYFRTMHIILSDKRPRRKSDTFYAVFSSMMIFLISVFTATEALFGQHIWLMSAGSPGGPGAYWQEHIMDWYVDWGTTSIVVLQLMTDALMIHRCRVVWDSYRAIIIPVILWTATLTLGILTDWTSSAPSGDIFFGIPSQFTLAYWSTSVLLNAVLTCMICYRIMRNGKQVQKHLGDDHASTYFTVTTMVIESMLPYTISGITLLVLFGMNSPTSVAFASIYVQMMCISPQILVLRVILGRAWNGDTTRQPQISPLRFSFGTATTSEGFDSIGARMHLQILSNVYLPDGHDKV